VHGVKHPFADADVLAGVLDERTASQP
jgi:hypothetical protein